MKLKCRAGSLLNSILKLETALASSFATQLSLCSDLAQSFDCRAKLISHSPPLSPLQHQFCAYVLWSSKCQFLLNLDTAGKELLWFCEAVSGRPSFLIERVFLCVRFVLSLPAAEPNLGDDMDNFARGDSDLLRDCRSLAYSELCSRLSYVAYQHSIHFYNAVEDEARVSLRSPPLLIKQSLLFTEGPDCFYQSCFVFFLFVFFRILKEEKDYYQTPQSFRKKLRRSVSRKRYFGWLARVTLGEMKVLTFFTFHRSLDSEAEGEKTVGEAEKGGGETRSERKGPDELTFEEQRRKTKSVVFSRSLLLLRRKRTIRRSATLQRVNQAAMTSTSWPWRYIQN